jgi:uncharacterized MnhB-related membrane protein
MRKHLAKPLPAVIAASLPGAGAALAFVLLLAVQFG